MIDEQGAPLAGVELTCRLKRGDQLLTRSDAEGNLAGEVATSEGWLSFRAEAPGRVPARVRTQVVAREELELGTLVLAPGGDLVGRVLEDGGRPPARGHVLLLPARFFPGHDVPPRIEEAGASFEFDDEDPEAVLAADGTFDLRGVPLGERFLVAEVPGGVAWSAPFEVLPGTTQVQELFVPTADERHWIGGIVRGPDGVAISGAVVWLDQVSLARSGADGTFLFELLEPGMCELSASDPELRLASAFVSGVASGQRDVVLELAALRWIDVRLMDARGAPIAWGNVWSVGGDSPVPMTPLGQRGVGRIPFAGRTLRLQADAPGFARVSFGPYSPADVEDGLVLSLQPGGFVRGRVTSGGRPIAGARLDLAQTSVPSGFRPADGPAPLEAPFWIRAQVDLLGQDGSTDRDGGFVLSVPGKGWFTLRVEAEGFPLTVTGPHELDPALARADLDVELVRGGSIVGSVRLPAGESANGRFVGASNGHDFACTAALATDGSFAFENLAPGGWFVRAVEPPVARLQELRALRAPRLERVDFDVEVRAGEVSSFTLDLARVRGCSVRGRFLLDGVVPQGWWFGFGPALTPDDGLVRRPLDPDGSFRAAAPFAGKYEAWLASDSGKITRNFELAEGETRWDLECATAVVTIEPPELHVMALTVEVELADGSRFQAGNFPGEQADPWQLRVPVGLARAGFFRETMHLPPSLAQPVMLAPGEERTLALPSR